MLLVNYNFAADAPGTALTAIAPEIGGAFVAHPSYVNSSATITAAKRVRGSFAGTSVFYSNTTPNSPDYDVDADIYYAGGAASPVGILLRSSSAQATYYLLRLNAVAFLPAAVELWSYNNGVPNLLGSAPFSPGPGQTLHLNLSVRSAPLGAGATATTLRGTVNGALAVVSPDASILSPGFAGMLFSSSDLDGTGLHLANFTVTTVVPPFYLSSPEADFVAAQMPALLAWPTATVQQKSAALAQASSDLDQGLVYQGRKYDLTQVLQFPRMAYEAAGRVRNWGVMAQPIVPPGYGDVVWDWDPTNLVPNIPSDVLQAVLYQADSILSGNREERLSEIHDGVRRSGTDGLSEEYERDPSRGGDTGLTRRAWTLLRKYRAREGRMM